MEVFIGIVVVSIIICVVEYIILKKNVKSIETDEKEIGMLVDNIENSFPMIQIVENNTIVPQEKNKIMDNNIKNAISLIDNTIPNAGMIGKNIKNGSELLNKNRAFFSTAKKGTENMMQVKGSNEVYGTQVLGNKFSGQTKFTEENKLIQNAGKDALVNAGFCTASMVVGQYYMNEINNKLDDIKDGMSRISNFLDAQYKSNLLHIISKMKEVIENKTEILGNDFSRDKRYDDILNIENDCSQLLGQANEIIKDNIKNTDIDYKKYEKNSNEIYKWYSRQQLLQKLLLEIGNLRYVLAYGNETSKLSHTQYNNYLSQSNSINENLEEWHNEIIKKLGIDMKKSRKNGGFFEIRKNTIGKINEDWAYDKLNDRIVRIIKSQTNIKKLAPYNREKQDEIIKIQKYNGEYYNLLG